MLVVAKHIDNGRNIMLFTSSLVTYYFHVTTQFVLRALKISLVVLCQYHINLTYITPDIINNILTSFINNS